MTNRTGALLTVDGCLAGSVLAFALAVYPYHYGLAESALLAGALVLLFGTVLDRLMPANSVPVRPMFPLEPPLLAPLAG